MKLSEKEINLLVKQSIKKETKCKTEESKVDIQSWLINQQERSIKHDHNHKHNLLVSNIAAADASRYQRDAGGV